MCRKWTDEDVDYLEMKWGNASIQTICKKLNRTESSIKNKVRRLKLGAFTENGNYITFNFLSESLGSRNGYTDKRLIANNLPIHYKKINKSRVKIVYLNEFWKWAKENKYILDFSKLEPGSLGEEPDWIDKKRKYDFQKKLKFKIFKTWTREDDEYLIFLLKQHKYTYEEISNKTNRKCESIKKRIDELKIKERPVIVYTSRWTKEEVNNLTECIKDNMPYELIADVVNKTTRQIRTKLYKMYSTENLKKVSLILREAG